MSHRTQSNLLGVALLIITGAVIVLLLSLAANRSRDLFGSEDAMAQRELSASGVPESESDILGRWYAEFAKSIKQMVLHPTGGTKASREYQRARAAQLVQQIEAIRAQLDQKTGLWIAGAMPRVYREGLKNGERQLIETGVRPKDSPFAGSFALVDREAVEVLARDTAQRLQMATKSMTDRAATLLRKTAQIGVNEADINRVIAGGIVEGQPTKTIRELRDAFEKVHGETVEVIDKNGDPINFAAKDYARMVVRTKTREATVTARHNRLAAVGVDLVAIIGLPSMNPCSAFLGMVFSLSGKSDKYEAYSSLPEGGPPFHPNCSKGTRPFIEQLASGKQLDQAEGLPDAKFLLGKDFTTAGRLYKDLQLHAQVKQNYATTANKLFGASTKKGGSNAA